MPTDAPPKMAGGKRAGLTILDQSFSSLSNFAVGIAAARIAGEGALGGFAFAYAAWQILAALHRSLVTDPMAIQRDVRGHDEGGSATVSRQQRRGIESGCGAEILLGIAGAVFFALIGSALLFAGQRTFGDAMLTLAPWLPLLLVQDYWRWVGFMSRRPGLALANDSVFNVVQGAAFAAVILLHFHSLVVVIGSWGLGSLAGALYGLRQHRAVPALVGGLQLMRDRWSLSKWLAGTSLSAQGAAQAFVFVVGAILGPVGLGGLRAAQTLVAGPSGVLIMAGGSIGLPESAKAYEERGWPGLLRVTRLVTAAGFLSFCGGAALVAVFGRTLLSMLYGHAYAHLQFAAVLMGVSYIALALALGPILVMKTTRNTRSLCMVQLLSVAMSLCIGAAFSVTFGVDGAAAAMIGTYSVTAVASLWIQHRLRRSETLYVPLDVEEPLEEALAGAVSTR